MKYDVQKKEHARGRTQHVVRSIKYNVRIREYRVQCMAYGDV